MKKIFKILLIALFFGGGIITENQVKAQTSVNVNLSVFQKSLSPYGRWVNHGGYGQVWIANVRGFRPYYTGGHWAYTDYGWTWVSDYNWGWAPFHYGRWNYETSLGWYWVPDYEWAPAWVSWRGGGDYYGWAPLSPGLNISVSFDNQIPYDRWVFAPHRYITSPYIYRYYAPRTRNVTIIKNTTVVNNVNIRNNVHYVSGPRREDVERVNHTKIRTYTVANSSRPGKTVINKNTVNVYRPVVNKTTVVNNNDKTVVNNNNKTVNKNSNNTTVNKTNNKTTVNKNSNNTTVKKNNNNTAVKKNNTNTAVKTNNKSVSKSNSATVKKVKKAQLDNNTTINKNVQNNKQPKQVNNHPVQPKPAVKTVNNHNQQIKKQTQPPKQMDRDSNKKKPVNQKK